MRLFDPIIINGMELKNRIVMLPMQLMLGVKNPRAKAFYLERAKGGVGAIIMCATSVDLFIDDKAWGRPEGVNRFIETMVLFTEEIRKTGAKIGIQLWHGNQLPAGNGAAVIEGAESVAPSTVNGMRELTVKEIQSIIQKFGKASLKAKQAGFDFIEVHGAHGYLPCQFFSSLDNRRDDQYGSDLFGRMQFGLELTKSIRKSVGNNYPIFYRIGAKENITGGISLGQSKRYALELEKKGVDAFDVSLGRVKSGASPNKKAKMGAYAYLAESIKKVVSIPVIAVGRINTPEIAESILSEKRADLIGIGRQLIADPYWPKKVLEGKTEDILSCESCNACFRPMRSGKWRPGDPICKVNKRAGKEIDQI
jgi:2,4-dienoyl-CoA reductase-like NADH-dependent reductase (Old Yellow Enzyme family)